jgi:hypothetical protein
MKISELRLFTSTLTNKQFNSDTQKSVYMNQFQKDYEFNKIEQEKYYYNKYLKLIKIEYYKGVKLEKLQLDRIKTFEYKNFTAYNMCFDESVAASHRWKRVTYRKFSATYEIHC